MCTVHKVLLIEDDAAVRDGLEVALRRQGHEVRAASTGEDGLAQLRSSPCDLVLLDLMLPGIDGFEVCRELRRGGSHVPVLMLTARDAIESRIAGLDSGADDYLIKPFDFGELLARLRAVIRRGRLPVTPAVLTVSHLRLDLRARQACRHDQPIKLTSREFALLEFLALHAGEVVGRAAIAEHVWDAPYESMSNVIDVLIQRLRRKIDAPDGSSLITTRRGEGYMLAPVTEASHDA